MRQVEVTSKTENIGGSAVFTVANHLCTVKFRCPKEDVGTCHFDWIDIDKAGKVSKHHGIKINQCTHVLVGEKYENVRGNNADEILKGEFPVYEIKDDDKSLYDAKSWMAVRKPSIQQLRIEMDMILNPFEKVNKKNRAFLSIKLPTGITMTINDADSTDECNDPSELKLSKDKYKVTFCISSGVSEESEITVYNSGNKNIVGALGVFAFEELQYNVVVMPLVDKAVIDVNKNLRVLRNQVNINKLNKETDKYFINLGIKLHFMLSEDSEYLTYDSTILPYKQCIDEQGRIKPDNTVVNDNTAKEFFEAVINNSENVEKTKVISQNHKGSQLLLTDRECTDKVIENPSNQNQISFSSGGTVTHTTEGYAQIGKTMFTLFKGQYNEAETCAHELGHNLGCHHTFKDNSFDDKLIYSEKYIQKFKGQYIQLETADNSTKKEEFESYLNKQHTMSQQYDKEGFKAYYKLESTEQYRIAALYYDQTGQQDKATQHRINQRKGDEKILYVQAKTNNIMDYSDNKECFFKWQWLMMRTWAKEHIGGNSL
ncbi:hypothetical protein [uncultured Bacteroides sp.]|uniref:hypothetical protein n=1 Tax=uncultured Bacteroides sp. TaxID=162156 RepID=UPI0025EBE9DE|nr:hypothetical protein [uncultured Bacteroides sp.]